MTSESQLFRFWETYANQGQFEERLVPNLAQSKGLEGTQVDRAEHAEDLRPDRGKETPALVTWNT